MALVIEIALVVVAPLPVTDCSVDISQTVTAPEDVLTAVSVPAVTLLTPAVTYELILLVVNTRLGPRYKFISLALFQAAPAALLSTLSNRRL